jgi:hypothetical protein
MWGKPRDDVEEVRTTKRKAVALGQADQRERIALFTASVALPAPA